VPRPEKPDSRNVVSLRWRRPKANPTPLTAMLDALREYQVPHTEADPSFDYIVRLPVHACETPAAVVTLVDESRQWSKASWGVDVRETHWDLSFWPTRSWSPNR
jgi:hypothetical protein